MGADQSQWCGQRDEYYAHEVDTEVAQIADQYQLHRESTELINQQQVEQLQRELNDALNEIEYMKNTHNKIDIEENASQLEQSTKRYNELMDSYQELQHEYEKYKASNAKLQRQAEDCNQYKASVLSLEQENIKLKQINAELQDEITTLTEIIQTHKASQNTDDYYNDIKHENECLKKQIKEMSEQTTMLKSELSDTRALKGQYERDLEKYKTLNVYANTLKTFDSNESSNSVDTHSQCKQENNDLKSEMIQLTQVIQQHKGKTHQLLQQNMELKRRIKDNEKTSVISEQKQTQTISKHCRQQAQQTEIEVVDKATYDALQSEYNALGLKCKEIVEQCERQKDRINTLQNDTHATDRDSQEEKEPSLEEQNTQIPVLSSRKSVLQFSRPTAPSETVLGTILSQETTTRKEDRDHEENSARKHKQNIGNMDDIVIKYKDSRTNDPNEVSIETDPNISKMRTQSDVISDEDNDDDDVSPTFGFHRSRGVDMSINESLNTVQSMNLFGDMENENTIKDHMNITTHDAQSIGLISTDAIGTIMANTANAAESVDTSPQSTDNDDDDDPLPFVLSRKKRLDRPIPIDEDEEPEPDTQDEKESKDEDAHIDMMLSLARGTGMKPSIGLDAVVAMKMFSIQSNDDVTNMNDSQARTRRSGMDHDSDSEQEMDVQETMERQRIESNKDPIGRRGRHVGYAQQMGPMAHFDTDGLNVSTILNRGDSSMINTGQLYQRQRNLSMDSNESLQHQICMDAEHAMLLRLLSNTNPNTFRADDDDDDDDLLSSKSEDDDGDLFLMKSMMNVLPK